MTTGRVDVHTHLLPGIDDGCPSFDDSLQCARTLVAAGYTHAFCTPHIWPTLPKNTIENVTQWTNELQSRLDAAGIPLRLSPGGEINLLWGWPAMRELRRDQIVTYAFAGQYVLFDFWADELPEYFEPAVRHLKSLKLTPILAHPERVVALNREDETIRRIQEMGVLLQMNTWCLTVSPDDPVRRSAERWLRAGRYFCFGTDSHNAASMPARIEGVRVAEQLVGTEAVERLTVHNPRQLLVAV
jgi:protein-tyrosine phosphatase